jgi:hypothetical protein
MGLNLPVKKITLLYFILKWNIHTDRAHLLAGYHDLDRADKHFIEGSQFVSISDWVEDIGHYCCNAHDFNDTGYIDILIDSCYRIPKDTENDYDSIEYRKYKTILQKLIKELSDQIK